jgi:hypothetical protein
VGPAKPGDRACGVIASLPQSRSCIRYPPNRPRFVPEHPHVHRYFEREIVQALIEIDLAGSYFGLTNAELSEI